MAVGLLWGDRKNPKADNLIPKRQGKKAAGAAKHLLICPRRSRCRGGGWGGNWHRAAG